jgi:hypothetical protein
MANKAEVLLSLGSNVEVVSQEDGRIAVIFDPKKKLGASKSGKSNIIATTGGNINVNGISIGFNAYRKA